MLCRLLNGKWRDTEHVTRRALFSAIASVAGLSLCPRLITAWKQRRERARFARLCAYGQARMRDRLRSQGLDIDRMTDDEKMDYVDRVIHEYRQEQRAKAALQRS